MLLVNKTPKRIDFSIYDTFEKKDLILKSSLEPNLSLKLPVKLSTIFLNIGNNGWTIITDGVSEVLSRSNKLTVKGVIGDYPEYISSLDESKSTTFSLTWMILLLLLIVGLVCCIR